MSKFGVQATSRGWAVFRDGRSITWGPDWESKAEAQAWLRMAEREAVYTASVGYSVYPLGRGQDAAEWYVQVDGVRVDVWEPRPLSGTAHGREIQRAKAIRVAVVEHLLEREAESRAHTTGT